MTSASWKPTTRLRRSTLARMYSTDSGCQFPHIFSLLLRKDGQATVRALSGTHRPGLGRDKNMIRTGIDRYAMRIGARCDVHQPLVGLSIDDAQHRSRRHVSGRQVIAIIPGVVPHFVDAPEVANGRRTAKRPGDDRAGSSIDHVFVGRERFAIVVAATYEEIVAGALNDAGGHAIRHKEAIDDDRSTGGPAATGVCQPRVDLVYGPLRGDALKGTAP